MPYYFTKTLHCSFDDAILRTTEALASEGFGVLTEIDVRATMKKKLDVEFRSYRILGACNPYFAHQAILKEDKIGTMLPCSIIVQEQSDGSVEVAAIDPVASMQAIENESLLPIATEVQTKLKRAMEALC
jgi:uncharacterized protein (DUF302 family)